MKRAAGKRLVPRMISNGIRIETFDNDDVVNLNVKKAFPRRVLHKSMSVVSLKTGDSRVHAGSNFLNSENHLSLNQAAGEGSD